MCSRYPSRESGSRGKYIRSLEKKSLLSASGRMETIVKLSKAECYRRSASMSYDEWKRSPYLGMIKALLSVDDEDFLHAVLEERTENAVLEVKIATREASLFLTDILLPGSPAINSTSISDLRRKLHLFKRGEMPDNGASSFASYCNTVNPLIAKSTSVFIHFIQGMGNIMDDGSLFREDLMPTLINCLGRLLDTVEDVMLSIVSLHVGEEIVRKSADTLERIALEYCRDKLSLSKYLERYLIWEKSIILNIATVYSQLAEVLIEQGLLKGKVRDSLEAYRDQALDILVDLLISRIKKGNTLLF